MTKKKPSAYMNWEWRETVPPKNHGSAKRVTDGRVHNPKLVHRIVNTWKKPATDTEPAYILTLASVEDPSGSLVQVETTTPWDHTLDTHENHRAAGELAALAVGFTKPALVVSAVNEDGYTFKAIEADLTPDDKPRSFVVYRSATPVKIKAVYGFIDTGSALYTTQSASLFIEHLGHVFAIARPLSAKPGSLEVKRHKRGWIMRELSTGAVAVPDIGKNDIEEFTAAALNRLCRVHDIGRTVGAWRENHPTVEPLNAKLPARAFKSRTVYRFADALHAYDFNPRANVPAPDFTARDITAAAMAELLASGDSFNGGIDESGQRYLDRASLKHSITAHRNFSCPVTGKLLDVKRALLLETANGDHVAGPYDLPGLAHALGKDQDAVIPYLIDRATVALKEQGIIATVRALDGRHLFAS